jgi:hypothetical protein
MPTVNPNASISSTRSFTDFVRVLEMIASLTGETLATPSALCAVGARWGEAMGGVAFE